ncbi:LOW QUALITY PROTEIN: mitochondrial mRNA pseudouridine synthase RPUSD3 [Cygnus olor]|uniref:LOW QUALITY PROTEIN: mitochondrial mRNA pseudouridine synthase RPUSD3 n=1 Tax=Cygnus olor TaxID=8869 RepID=UPI001ADE681A|nr:LOW QUALITY PROTEIN: mitochondrial mRNA pseudouridine synthase RPUSD3 [Cygnus olor]
MASVRGEGLTPLPAAAQAQLRPWRGAAEGPRARWRAWGRGRAPWGRGRTPSPEEVLGLLEASGAAPEGALLALNKPPGLPVLGHPGELSLAALLPALRRRLGLPAELHVVKAPPRDSSGLVLLSGCRRATEQLQRFFSDERRRGRFPATYCAVTVGVPAEAEGEIRVGLCRRQHGAGAVAVPVPCPGRRSVSRGEVRSTLTRYRLLGAAGGCALLQLQPRTAFPGQLRVHLTLLLCPALGDHEHGARVGRVLGEPFPAAPPGRPRAPPDAPAPRTQVLDAELLRRLRLPPRCPPRLPLHLHLQGLALPRAPLRAPPPPHFLRTLRLLGLPPPA